MKRRAAEVQKGAGGGGDGDKDKDGDKTKQDDQQKKYKQFRPRKYKKVVGRETHHQADREHILKVFRKQVEDHGSPDAVHFNKFVDCDFRWVSRGDLRNVSVRKMRRWLMREASDPEIAWEEEEEIEQDIAAHITFLRAYYGLKGDTQRLNELLRPRPAVQTEKEAGASQSHREYVALQRVAA